MIRYLESSDLNELREIHSRHFASEFTFPDFCKSFMHCFVSTDDDGKIICAGGIKTIAEAAVLTNKDYSVRRRRTALYEILQATMFAANNSGFDQIHAFIQDDMWSKHLKEIGFHNCKGESLYLNL